MVLLLKLLEALLRISFHRPLSANLKRAYALQARCQRIRAPKVIRELGLNSYFARFSDLPEFPDQVHLCRQYLRTCADVVLEEFEHELRVERKNGLTRSKLLLQWLRDGSNLERCAVAAGMLGGFDEIDRAAAIRILREYAFQRKWDDHEVLGFLAGEALASLNEADEELCQWLMQVNARESKARSTLSLWRELQAVAVLRQVT